MEANHEGEPSSRNVWVEAAATPEFTLLKKRLFRFLVPATGFVVIVYLGFVFLTSFAQDELARKVGGVPIVLFALMGLIVMTFVLATLYNRYAARRLDPLAARIRDQLEDDRS